MGTQVSEAWWPQALGAHPGPAQREAAASGPQCGRKVGHLLPRDTDALEVSIFFVAFKPYDYFFRVKE